MRTFAVTVALLASLASSYAHPLEERAAASRVYTQCKDSGHFALTFDDGPYKYNGRVIQDLDNGGALGTFFVNGNNYGCIYDYAEDLQKAFAAGHIIGSHTWSHADIAKLSTEELNNELKKVETALKKILGIRPKLFRPPFGSYDDNSLQVLKKRGYSTIDWSMDSGDSDNKSVEYSKKEYQKQARRYPAPGIGLNHETYKGTAYTVTPYAIKTLQDAGYKLVSIPECLGLQPYEYIAGKESRNGSWKC